MLLNCGVGEDSWKSLRLQGDPTSPSWRRSVLGVHWKDWCWSWNSSPLATWCKELTHWKRPWCWEGLGAGGEGDDRGWDGWLASLTQWTWVWVNSGIWWWTGRPGMLRFVGSKRVKHDWKTELNWTEFINTEKAMATHSITLGWKIPWMEEPGSLQSMGSLGVRYDWATQLSLFTLMHWRRKWQPTPVFLPGESQGRGSLVGCRLWGRTESDMTEAT